METKKNKEKNLDALRMPLALTGFLFTGGLILASFSYVTPIEEELISQRASSEQVINIAQADQPDTPDETPVQPEEQFMPPPSDLIDTVDNTITPPIAAPPVTPPQPPVGPPIVRTPPAQIIDFPDVEAAFPGGAGAMTSFIVNNIQYPETSIDMDEQGKVYLSFVVGADGKISQVKVERGVSRDLDREAKRIVRAMPKWEPGEVGGKKVPTRCRLPIVFTLH